MGNETELLISRVGFPPFSARNCQQQLMPIQSGEVRRTINGRLVYLGKETHHKFKSSIVCDDKTSFAFDQFWVGVEVEVSCIQRLWQEATVGSSALQLLRPAAPQTVMVQDAESNSIPYNFETQLTLIVQAGPGTKVLLSYCPILKMRVTHFSLLTQEWAEKSSWRLELEEI